MRTPSLLLVARAKAAKTTDKRVGVAVVEAAAAAKWLGMI